MKSTQRSSYDASFKLKAIDLAIQEGNCAAAHKLGVNELMMRRWRRQREELMQCEKKDKSFQRTWNQVAWTWKCPEGLGECTESRRPRCIHCADPTESQNNRPRNEYWRFQSWAVMVFQIWGVKTCPSGHRPHSVSNSPRLWEKSCKLPQICWNKDGRKLHRPRRHHKYGWSTC